MAHRCFETKIIDKTSFITLSYETQVLYFHLNLNADDDGIVEAFKVLRTYNIDKEHLLMLESKNFITILNDDLVTIINDWLEHNTITADRKKHSIYQNLARSRFPDIVFKPGKDVKQNVYNLDTTCIQNENKMSHQVKVSQSNLIEGNLNKVVVVNPACVREDNNDDEKANADEVWEVDLNNHEPMNVHDDMTINTSHRLIQPLVATIRKYSKRKIVDAISPALITSCEANLQKVYDLCKKTGNDYNDYMVGQLNYSMNSRKLEQSTVIVRTLSDIASASIRYLQTLDAKKQAEPDVVPLHKPEPEEKPLTLEQQKELAEMIARNRRGEL